jgi:DNA-binding NarL/FixJ family response regulator
MSLEVSMNRPRILIADDHTLICEALRKMIEPEYQVVGSVGDGRSLLETAPLLRPDVVLLDVAMPLLNGIDAGRQLKRIMPRTKLIYLTMNADRDVAVEAFRIGASGYLLKSSAGPELLKAIRETLRGGRYITPPVADCMKLTLCRAPQALHHNKTLTERQREVLQLIAEGYSMEQIALILNITIRTVAFHKYRIMEEFKIGNNADLVIFAVRQNLVSAA